jgi:hypothetical protein
MTTTKTANQYTLEDIGCYVDGAKGIYMVDDIVRIAEGHGMKTPEGCGHEAGDGSYTEWSTCLFSNEISECPRCSKNAHLIEECEEFMNDKFPVDNAFWGWSFGDWGLWSNE